MSMSFFDELDSVRIDHPHGREVRTIGRVVFAMMFYMTGSDDPGLPGRLRLARDYCLGLIPLQTYRWCEAEGETGRLYDLRDARQVAQIQEVEAAQQGATAGRFGLYDFVQKEGEAPGHAFSYAWDAANDSFGAQSRLQWNIPLPWLEAQAEAGLLQRMFTDLTNILHPLHAQGGLCMATARDRNWMQTGAEALYPLLHQFPGLMNGWAHASAAWLGRDMQTVNWLTMVHDTLLARCGGRDAVTAQLTAPGFVVSDAADGIIVQAGMSPQLGNRETGEAIALYGALARALQAARVPVTPPGRMIQHAYQIPGTFEGGDDALLVAAQKDYLTRFDAM
jgi:hypothetical protein